MKLLLQRVREARVEVDCETIGAIGPGLLVLVGLGQGDSERMFEPAIDKMLNLRIFADEAGAMNRSVLDAKGGILLVSQFTLYADVRKGRRPSFTEAMPPAEARELYARFVAAVERRYPDGPVESGIFAAMMQVHLVNDGPVTIMLDSAELKW